MINADSFWSTINTLCLKYGGTVTSGIRSAARNKSVGGHPNSWHLTGLAADVALDDPGHVAKFVEHAAKFGVRALDEGDHIHCQPQL